MYIYKVWGSHVHGTRLKQAPAARYKVPGAWRDDDDDDGDDKDDDDDDDDDVDDDHDDDDEDNDDDDDDDDDDYVLLLHPFPPHWRLAVRRYLLYGDGMTIFTSEIVLRFTQPPDPSTTKLATSISVVLLTP